MITPDKLPKIIPSLAHIMAGIICGITTLLHPVMAVIATLLFLIYELDEDWHLSDKAFKDILEFAIGYYLVAVMYIIYATVLFIG